MLKIGENMFLKSVYLSEEGVGQEVVLDSNLWSMQMTKVSEYFYFSSGRRKK